MGVNSRYDAYSRIQKILETYQKEVSDRADLVKSQRKSGYEPTKKTLAEMQRQDRIARETAIRGLDLLRGDYLQYVNEKSRPFPLLEIRNIDKSTRTVVGAPDDYNLRFLKSLQYIQLNKAELQFYADFFNKSGDLATLRALATKAKEWGYQLDGVYDAEKEMQKFDKALKRASLLMDPVTEGDSIGEVNHAIFYDELQTMIKTSPEYNPDGSPMDSITVEKIPESIEESIALEMNAEKSPKTDEYAEKLQFIQGFDGLDGLRDEMETQAKAQARRVMMDNEAKEEASKEE